MITTLTNKQPSTLPKTTRDTLQDRTRPVRTLKGMLPKPTKPVTLDEMDRAIAERLP